MQNFENPHITLDDILGNIWGKQNTDNYKSHAWATGPDGLRNIEIWEAIERIVEAESLKPAPEAEDTAARKPHQQPRTNSPKGNERNATAKAPKPAARPRSRRGESPAAKVVNDNAGRTALDL